MELLREGGFIGVTCHGPYEECFCGGIGNVT